MPIETLNSIRNVGALRRKQNYYGFQSEQNVHFVPIFQQSHPEYNAWLFEIIPLKMTQILWYDFPENKIWENFLLSSARKKGWVIFTCTKIKAAIDITLKIKAVPIWHIQKLAKPSSICLIALNSPMNKFINEKQQILIQDLIFLKQFFKTNLNWPKLTY